MSNYKILVLDDEVTENKLEVFVNDNGKIALREPGEDHGFIITLDQNDALELANELIRLSNDI